MWSARPLRLFWTMWKERNKIAFEDATLFIQKLKSSFVYFLWAKTILCIKEGIQCLLSSLSGWDLSDFRFCSFFFLLGVFWGLFSFGQPPHWLLFVLCWAVFSGYLWFFCGVMVCFLVLSMSCHFGGSPLEYILLSYLSKKKKKIFRLLYIVMYNKIFFICLCLLD